MLTEDCHCISVMLPRTLLLTKKLFHTLSTCIPSFLLEHPSSFSTMETMGKYWPTPQKIPTSPLKSKSHNSNSKVQGWVPSSSYFLLTIPNSWARDTSVTQAGRSVKCLLEPLSQILSGVSFPISSKLTSYIQFWTVDTIVEPLKKELGFHQEDNNPGPSRLFRLIALFHPLRGELIFLFFLILGH